MWSCSDDDDETESVVITQTSTDETSEVYATSATFKLATRGVESFAYQVVEGADATAPAGEVIYAEAQENNIVISAEDGDNEVTVYGLSLIHILSNIAVNMCYALFFAGGKSPLRRWVLRGFGGVIAINVCLLLFFYLL